MWQYFGPGSVFVTVCPCDECSFRVKMYAMYQDHQEVPTIEDMTEEECILDLDLRQKIRSMYPGLCALEYKSVMEIVLLDLLGWDIKNKKPREDENGNVVGGIFSILEAWALSDEEQGRKTLHGHLIAHIRNFHTLCKLLFHAQESVRKAVRKIFKEYASKIMSVSLEMQFLKGEPSSSTLIFPHKTESNQECSGQLKEVGMQQIRDMHHQMKCLNMKGIVANCDTCHQEFSTADIVNKALDTWRNFAQEEGHNFPQAPLSHAQLHVAGVQYSYFQHSNDQASKKYSSKYISTATKLKFNVHDFKHRKKCFKGEECRFYFPFSSNIESIIRFDECNEYK